MEFCKAYNAATESQRGQVVPVEISVFEDRSFTFITKTPPASRPILAAAGIEKGSGEPHKTKVRPADKCPGARQPDTKMPGLKRQRPRAPRRSSPAPSRQMGITVEGPRLSLD
jgi:large subunit ribosomal protein L11